MMTHRHVREVSLTVLLALQIYFLFFLQPAASIGFDFGLPLTESVVVVVVAVVMAASPSRGAAITIALALVSASVAIVMRRRLASATTDCLTAFAALGALLAISWVVARSVYAPGLITRHRLRGAMVLYFNIALAFGVIFRLIEALAPGSFKGIEPGETRDQLAADILYFSVITLSTTGFGDIVPLHRFARSMASLEAIVGQLYIATVLARLITLPRDQEPPDDARPNDHV
nr:potassium channel family protein [uncultured Rhodopila sp.]